MPDANLIYIGTGRIFRRTTGSIDGDPAGLLPPSGDALTNSATWQDMGWTVEGVNVAHNTESYDVMTDSILGSLQRIPTSLSFMATGELMEVDLGNTLQHILGMSNPQFTDSSRSNTAQRVGVGGLQYATQCYVIEGLDSNERLMRVVMYRAVMNLSGELAFRRGQEMRLPFELTALVNETARDDAAGRGNLGYIERVQA